VYTIFVQTSEERIVKNITLSAEEDLIERSRTRARRENTTLNAVFRQWLKHYAGRESASAEYKDIMERLSYAHASGPYSREEMNER
jgi:hypothetical protein